MELLQVWAGRDLKSLIENLCLRARREARGEAGERYSDKDSFGFLLAAFSIRGSQAIKYRRRGGGNQ